jgi:hypothetical protein
MLPKSIPFYLSVLLLIGIAVLVYMNTLGLRRGPTITINTPIAYSTVDAVVEVSGRIPRAKEANINGKALYFNKRGDFTTTIILTPPLDSLDIYAISAYGQESTSKIVLGVSE